MSFSQIVITVAMVVLGTMTTRFLPFLLFPAGKETPPYIRYLGKYLPPAVFGLLVVYCLKNVSVFSGSHGLPELIAILAVVKDQGYLVDICLIYALISFLAVVVLTRIYTGVYREAKDYENKKKGEKTDADT